MTVPPATGTPYRVSMVCLGNICRSPMAAAVLTSRVEQNGLADDIVVESAGTGSWHIGEQADPRARAALARRGYDGEQHRARQFRGESFDGVDLVLAMDRDNLRTLRRLAGDDAVAARVMLLREFDPDVADGDDLAVPDPYYGDERDFESGLDIIERSVDSLFAQLQQHLSTAR